MQYLIQVGLDGLKRVLENRGFTISLKVQKEIDEFAKSTIEMFAGEIEEIEAVCANPLLNPVVDKFGKNITIIKNDDNTFKTLLGVCAKSTIIVLLLVVLSHHRGRRCVGFVLRSG